MYVLSRLALAFFGLLLTAALLVLPSSHLKIAAEVLVLVPLTACAGLFWILAQTAPPAKAPRGTPAELKWKKDAGLFWGALGIFYLLAVGFVSADQSNDQARRYRDMAAEDRRQAESVESMERWNRSQYDHYGYGSHDSYSSSYESSYGDRLIEQLDISTAEQKETLAMIGYGYMGLAIIPLVALIYAASRRTITNAELYPQQGYAYGYGGHAWPQQYGPQQYRPQGGYAAPQAGYAQAPEAQPWPQQPVS